MVAPAHVLASPNALPDWVTDKTQAPHSGAVLVAGAVGALPVHVATLGAGLPAGELIAAIQGQQDLARARAMAAKLGRSMNRSGRAVSQATIDDATGAGASSVVQWRNGQAMPGAEHGAAGVCWRAVVASMSADGLGESVPLFEFTAEGLAGSGLPLPGQHETRQDKAARLLYERARAKRPALLARRIEHLKATRGGRGRRADSWDKLHRAAAQLLAGESCQDAALAAGYTDSTNGKATAGDRLRQAARRLGFKFQFDLRQSDGRAVARTSHALGAALSAHYTAQLAARPSAVLPLNGPAGADKLRRIARHSAQRTAALARRTRQAARDAQAARHEAKRAQVERRTARRFAKSGLWPDWFLTSAPGVRRWF